MKKTGTINLKTARLILRNLKPKDVSRDYADWLNDPEINKYLGCANTVQTIETCREYVRAHQKCGNAALAGIFLKKGGMHIGNLTLSAVDPRNKTASIGISIGRREYAGKGLAREALDAVVRYCFKRLGLHRLWAGVHVSNSRSLNLFIKCGFKKEGLLREAVVIDGKFEDGYIFSILEKDLEVL